MAAVDTNTLFPAEEYVLYFLFAPFIPPIMGWE